MIPSTRGSTSPSRPPAGRGHRPRARHHAAAFGNHESEGQRTRHADGVPICSAGEGTGPTSTPSLPDSSPSMHVTPRPLPPQSSQPADPGRTISDRPQLPTPSSTGTFNDLRLTLPRAFVERIERLERTAREAGNLLAPRYVGPPIRPRGHAAAPRRHDSHPVTTSGLVIDLWPRGCERGGFLLGHPLSDAASLSQ